MQRRGARIGPVVLTELTKPVAPQGLLDAVVVAVGDSLSMARDWVTAV